MNPGLMQRSPEGPDPVRPLGFPRHMPSDADAMIGPATDISNAPVILDFELDDPVALADLLSRRLTSIAVSSDGAEGSKAIGTYASHGSIFVSRARFTGTWTYDFPHPFDGVIFYLPTQGQVRADLPHGSVVGTASRAIAIEAGHCRRLTFTDDFARRAIAVPRRALAGRLSHLLKRQIVEPPVFEVSVDAAAAGMLALQALMDFATSTEFGRALNEGVLRAHGLRESLLDVLLEVWSHSHSKALNGPAVPVVPRHVKLVTDYLAANPNATVNSQALATISGVSLRSLQEGFSRFVGMPIVAYQRHVRLQRAYDDLVAEPAVLIEDIARRWGFTNAGRFTRYFREAYGANPFEIARKDTRRSQRGT